MKHSITSLIGKTLWDRTDTRAEYEGVRTTITKKGDKYHIQQTFIFGRQMKVKYLKPMDKDKAQRYVDAIFRVIPSIEIV